MKLFIVLFAALGVASAGAVPPVPPAAIISRAPAFDSSVIKPGHLGENVGSSVAESHAYAVHNPIVQQVATPIAVSYADQAPVVAAGPVLSLSAGIPAGAVAFNPAVVA